MISKTVPCTPTGRSGFTRRQVNADSCRTYTIHLTDDLLGRESSRLAECLKARKSLLVTTPTVFKLYADGLIRSLGERGLDVSALVLPLGEMNKSLDQVTAICREAQRVKLDRTSFLVGMGGGVCTDLVTLAASLLRRGIGHVRIPTTLVAQVDAAVGVKGAVNFGHKKNSLGCYYAPTAVFVDPGFLGTLPPPQLSLGLAEMIKISLVNDRSLFDRIEQHAPTLIDSGFSQPREVAFSVIWRSIMDMIDELETNLYEDQTYQRLVDFGHTFSPALEASSEFTMSHGDAVAVDMAFSCLVACELGLLDEDSCRRAMAAMIACGLPIDSHLLTESLIRRALQEAVRHRGGRLHLVVPTRIGAATFIEHQERLSDKVVAAALRRLRRRSGIRDSSSGRSSTCLVFDIGGTNMRAAIYHTETKTLGRSAVVPTPNHHRFPDLSQDDLLLGIIEGMDELAQGIFGDQGPAKTCVAFAGPLNDRSQVMAAPTIWGRNRGEPVDLLGRLQCLWPSSRTFLLNDVSAAGYRYLRHAKESLCIVTVGSGIGNKVFVEGKPMTGPAGRGGEMGHIRVDHSAEALTCDCGGQGHLGGIASGRGTLATARWRADRDPCGFSRSALGELVDGRVSSIENAHIVQAFRDGDRWTEDVVTYVARKLGNALASIHLMLGIERFIVYGGFAMALGERYRKLVVKAAAGDTWNSGQDWNEWIELGCDDDDSGLIGAGRYATEFSEGMICK